MKILYTGPVFDSSGYAQFSRNFILGLVSKGYDVKVNAMSQDHTKSDLGAQAKLINPLVSSSFDDREVNVINLTPDRFKEYVQPDMTNIGFTMFEADSIPSVWVEECNKMDAIFVPSSWNKSVFESSGVTVPIHVVHAGTEVGDIKTRSLSQVKSVKDKYKFYSVFQWTERKNPQGLIRGFLSAFDRNHDVALILKTYGNDTSPKQQQVIQQKIFAIASSMRLYSPPPIVLIPNLLSTEEIAGLHKDCDCFVLPHRAEGFGMPHIEAMAHGNLVITTGYSGNTDFMSHHQDSLLLSYQSTPIFGLPWIKWYESHMQWAEPNIGEMIDYMKLAKKGGFAIKSLAKQAKKRIESNFSWGHSADKMIDAIKVVLK